MRKKSLTLLMLFLLLSGYIALNSCSGLYCSFNNGVSVNYVAKGDSITDTLTVLAVRDGLPDTIILYKLQNIKTFSLPMSYNNEQDKLHFVFTDTLGNTITDSVTITKTNTPYLESVDCPTYFFHTITSIKNTTNRIDHIDINNANVDLDGKENLYIYFKSSN